MSPLCLKEEVCNKLLERAGGEEYTQHAWPHNYTHTHTHTHTHTRTHTHTHTHTGAYVPWLSSRVAEYPVTQLKESMTLQIHKQTQQQRHTVNVLVLMQSQNNRWPRTFLCTFLIYLTKISNSNTQMANHIHTDTKT